MKPHTPAKLLPSQISMIAALMCLALTLAGTGCSSFSGPGSASFASVTIQNHSGQEVAAATTSVFSDQGYKGGLSGSGEMTFEKETSRATTLAREGLVNTYYGAEAINRVRVELIDLGNNTIRLQCKAFMVTGGSDPFFQDEVPVAHVGRGPYQSLLNQVKTQLK